MNANLAKRESEKIGHRIICNIVSPGSRVLDLGCGDGALMEFLVNEKKVKAQGIELEEEAIYKCVERRLNVFHGDIDSGLPEYKDKSFDYVILNQSFQEVKKPEVVLKESLRVGRKVIISFPNFAHYSARSQIFFKGRSPVTTSLPYEWYNTPNLHFLSISDFISYCNKKNMKIEKSIYLAIRKRIYLFPNVFANIGVFLISR